MLPDGRLQGSGATDIAGRIQIGVRSGTRHFADGHTEPISEPVFGPATRHCTAGSLTTSGPSPQRASLGAAAGTAVGLLLNGDTKPPKSDDPGPRFEGEYGSQAGFDLEFVAEGVVVGCREAAVLRPYTVVPSGNQVQLRIEYAPAPLVLTIGSDGRLTGAGSVRVDGRQIIKMNDDGSFSFAPRSASCTIGTVALTGGG